MKEKKAVALKYTGEYNTPKVTAIGFGQIADNIIKIANGNDIPVVENKELTDKLSNVPINTEIPYELYEAVAEIIAFIYYLDNTSK